MPQLCPGLASASAEKERASNQITTNDKLLIINVIFSEVHFVSLSTQDSK
jgi:hypothetical protein